MASSQFCVRIPSELDELLVAYAKQNGTTKTKVMVDALAHYLGFSKHVPLIHRMVELEERMAGLEAQMRQVKSQ